MNPLASMAKTVLLGTEKRPPPRPTADGDVGDLLESLPQDEVERAVLRGAAVLATCQSAGWLPPVVEEATEAAPVEADSEPLPPAIHQTLAAILADGPPRLQAESFRLLASRGRTLPHRLLPKALHLGRAQAALRPFLLPVLGARGDWLARRNSDWGFSVGGTGADTHDENWEHGSLDQRKAALTKIRSLTPARARDLAAAVMKTEAARERAAFLEILGDGLSPADQDLLESALADKSKEVRLTAARLLSTLPDSPLARRMTARLADCLHVEKKFLRGLTAQITPPAAFGANWAQDTLEEAVPAGVRIGQRAWWLLQLVKYSPLGWWESVAPWSPSEWWKWAEKSEWKDALWQGWSTALRWQRNTAWAEAILSHDPSAARRPEMLDLLEAIPLPKRESLFLRLLGAAPVKVSLN